MKKIVLFIVIVMQCSLSSAQQYIPFPTTNAEWIVDYTSRAPSGQPDNHWTEKYKIVGTDTIINAVTYKKITFGNNQYFGGLRENNQKQVYFLFGDPSASEKLLYDFSKNTDDTIHNVYSHSLGYTTNVVVSSVDSVLIGSTYHRRLNFDNVSWIEGVGGTDGLMDCQYILNSSGFGVRLTCFSLSGIQQYPNYGGNCSEAVGINEFDFSADNLNLSPNPSNGNFNISLNTSGIRGGFSLTIFNTKGQAIYIELCEANSAEYTKNIDLGTCSKGLYLIQVNVRNQQLAGKKIIIE